MSDSSGSDETLARFERREINSGDRACVDGWKLTTRTAPHSTVTGVAKSKIKVQLRTATNVNVMGKA